MHFLYYRKGRSPKGVKKVKEGKAPKVEKRKEVVAQLVPGVEAKEVKKGKVKRRKRDEAPK